MYLLSSRISVALALLLLTAVPVTGQSTREEWLTLRTRKQARHHRLPSVATQPNAFVITAIRFFSDSSGKLVGVGEARNNTPFDLSYSRINFRFLDANGTELGREWTYLHGGVNARILGNNAYETLLVPGATGFFKIWTTIPASAMASYTAAPAGENLLYVPPQAAFVYRSGSFTGRPEDWDPWVFGFLGPPVAQRASGRIFNDNPFDSLGDPRTDLPSYFAHSIQLSVAAYQDGVIADVQSVPVAAPLAADPCRGELVTGMGIEQEASVTVDFARPVNSIGRKSIEWHESVVTPRPTGFPGQGGPASFTIERECGWTVSSTVPWISVVEGASSDRNAGQFTVYVEPNPSTAERSGFLIVSGEYFPIVQGLPCHIDVNPTMFLGPGLQRSCVIVRAPTSCLWGVRANAPWLTPVPQTALCLDARPNFTGVTRSSLVTLGSSSFTVYQSPASRSADVNNDGHLDLLWRHAGGGIATWRMKGLRMIDGTLLSPGRPDLNTLAAVGAGDFDSNGTTDVVWQNDLDGAPSWWFMEGTVMVAPSWITYPGIDSGAKIRAVADFNRDGHPDLVWQNPNTGRLFLWFMHGVDRLRIVPLGPGVLADLNWKIVGSGDFNRDGWQDLVWQHETNGQIAVWKMRGAMLLQSAWISPGQVADLNWKVRAVGDLNGDDMPDLIWQHRTGGQVAAWVMNGTALMSGIVIAQVADTNWEIVGPR